VDKAIGNITSGATGAWLPKNAVIVNKRTFDAPDKPTQDALRKAGGRRPSARLSRFAKGEHRHPGDPQEQRLGGGAAVCCAQGRDAEGGRHVRPGRLRTCILGCIIFAAVSGSSTATSRPASF